MSGYTFIRKHVATWTKFGNTFAPIVSTPPTGNCRSPFGHASIVPFPEQGHKRPDLTSKPLRFILVREYLIAYAPDEKPLWVVAVMHGRRSPRILAAILRGRN